MSIKIRSKFLLYLIYSILFLILFLLQTSPSLQIKIFNLVPMLILPLIINIAIFENLNVSCSFAIVFGLVMDLQSVIFGFNSIFFVLTSILVYYLIKNLLKGNIFVVIAFNVLFESLYFIFEFILSAGYKYNIFNLFLKDSLIKISISIIFTMVLYVVFYALSKMKKLV
ncbi:MAG: hypothetical protein RR436_01655 [Clostridia bacterium]